MGFGWRIRRIGSDAMRCHDIGLFGEHERVDAWMRLRLAMDGYNYVGVLPHAGPRMGATSKEY